MAEGKQRFDYTYSASEQKEIEAIRRRYLPNQAPSASEKLNELRKLDAGVVGKATAASLCVGLISTLFMGLGMSLILTDFGAELGLDSAVIPGLILGVVGMIGMVAAYPVYKFTFDLCQKKAAPRILELTDELSD